MASSKEVCLGNVSSGADVNLVDILVKGTKKRVFACGRMFKRSASLSIQNYS